MVESNESKSEPGFIVSVVMGLVGGCCVGLMLAGIYFVIGWVFHGLNILIWNPLGFTITPGANAPSTIAFPICAAAGTVIGGLRAIVVNGKQVCAYNWQLIDSAPAGVIELIESESKPNFHHIVRCGDATYMAQWSKDGSTYQLYRAM